MNNLSGTTVGSSNPSLNVREIRETDITFITDYWLKSDPEFLKGMGVDLSKIPSENDLTEMLQNQIISPIEQKRAYCLIWEIDGKAIGHCNTNPTTFGEEAFLHLHIWKADFRRKGSGSELLKMSVAMFFDNLQLKRIFSQPYALNPAPNRTLEKAGFTFVKEYITVPGSINFEQPVKLWMIEQDNFRVQNQHV